MISARQELDLRPQFEGLDRLILRSEGIAPGALTFAFRPLWQLDASAKAALALSRAQATAVYAGLGLWPAATTARLVEAQLVEDGVYPNAAAVFAEAQPAADGATGIGPTLDFDPAQPRDPQGRWTTGGEGSLGPAAARAGARQTRPAPNDPDGLLGLLNRLNPIGTAQAQDLPPKEEEEGRSPVEPGEREPGEPAEL